MLQKEIPWPKSSASSTQEVTVWAVGSLEMAERGGAPTAASWEVTKAAVRVAVVTEAAVLGVEAKAVAAKVAVGMVGEEETVAAEGVDSGEGAMVEAVEVAGVRALQVADVVVQTAVSGEGTREGAAPLEAEVVVGQALRRAKRALPMYLRSVCRLQSSTIGATLQAAGASPVLGPSLPVQLVRLRGLWALRRSSRQSISSWRKLRAASKRPHMRPAAFGRSKGWRLPRETGTRGDWLQHHP